MRSALSPAVPAFLQRRNNDEFVAPPLTDRERAAARAAATLTAEAAERLRLSATEYTESRRGSPQVFSLSTERTARTISGSP